MLKVEIVSDKTSGGYPEYVILNGIALKRSYYIGTRKSAVLFLNGDEGVEIVSEASIKELSEHFTVLHFDRTRDNLKNISFGIEVFPVESNYNEGPPLIKITVNSQLDEWSNPWTIRDFGDELKKQVNYLENGSSLKFWLKESESLGSISKFGVEYVVSNIKMKLGAIIEQVIPLILKTIADSNEELRSKTHKDSLVTAFNFPKETEVSCKQYLLYFAQFLSDLKIDAKTEFKENAGEVLFKVTPKNKNESLAKIKEALQVYLDAPGSPDFSTIISSSRDIAVLQWEANVHHLKSQLALASAMLVAKDAHIEALQLSNYQYKQIVINNDYGEKQDGEDLVKDIVTVKKFEGSGFSINLPEILRRLKRIF